MACWDGGEGRVGGELLPGRCTAQHRRAALQRRACRLAFLPNQKAIVPVTTGIVSDTPLRRFSPPYAGGGGAGGWVGAETGCINRGRFNVGLPVLLRICPRTLASCPWRSLLQHRPFLSCFMIQRLSDERLAAAACPSKLRLRNKRVFKAKWSRERLCLRASMSHLEAMEDPAEQRV